MRSFFPCSLRHVAQISIVLACGLCACSPALNWRETRPPDSGVSALFPCKPDHHVRRVTLAGAKLMMQLSSCTAADSVYALSRVDVGEAVRVTPVLEVLREVAAENIGGPTAVKD
ncbi:MAG: hypothetical protein WCJ87_09005, partial [Burkholderiales bacterium]